MAKAMTIGGYEIIEEIGRGGMSVVYKARQASLQRIVALKVLPRHLSEDPLFVARFEREATAIARLSHPHIIQVYDKGQEKNIYFFAMEYVAGHSLGDDLRLGPLPINRTLAISKQICEGLAYAHQQGVVHRDIKPQNILIDPSGYAKIADFGIAQLTLPDHVDEGLTGQNESMGTFDYMAPEQKTNAAGVDHRADIYSFGVLLYQMLTGALPRTSFALPSQRNPRIPPAMDKVVSQCLQEKPSDRYQNALDIPKELAKALAPPARKKSLPAAPSWALYAGGGALGILLVAGVILLLPRGASKTSPPSTPVPDPIHAETVAALEPPLLLSKEPVPPRAAYDLVESGLQSAKAVTSRERSTTAPTPSAAHRFNVVVSDQPRVQVKDANRVSPEVMKAQEALKSADSLLENRIFNDAAQTYRALVIDSGLPESLRARALFGVGKTREASGDDQGAVKEYLAVTTQFPEQSSIVAEAHYRAGLLNMTQLDQFDVADRNFARVIDDFPNTDACPSALYQRGILYEKQMSGGLSAAVSGGGNKTLQDKAFECFAKVVQQYPKAPEIPECLFRMGQICEDRLQKRYEEAIQHYQKIATDYPDSKHPAHFRQGELYSDLEQKEKAIEAYTACIQRAAEAEWHEKAQKKCEKLQKELAKGE